MGVKRFIPAFLWRRWTKQVPAGVLGTLTFVEKGNPLYWFLVSRIRLQNWMSRHGIGPSFEERYDMWSRKRRD